MSAHEPAEIQQSFKIFLKCTDDRLQQFTISAREDQLVLRSSHVTDESGEALTFFHDLRNLRVTSINSADSFGNLYNIRLTQMGGSKKASHRNLCLLSQE